MDNLKKIAVTFSGNKVGSMALTPEGLCAFEYASEWIADGFSISPFELPLRPGVFVGRPRPFGGGFGVFDDSLPDGWGMLVLDRYLRSQGINPTTLNLLDRLALVGSTGRGALSFEPDHSITKYDDIVNFDALATDAARILTSDTYMGRGIEEFQRHGGSPGGARPKVSVTIDGEGMNGFHTTTFNDIIAPEPTDLVAIAVSFGLDRNEAKKTFDSIRAAIAQDL